MSTDPHVQPPAKRPLWRILLGAFFLVVAAFAVLGTLSAVASGSFEQAQDGAEVFGMLLGAMCCIGLPLIAGLLLLLLPARR